MEEIPTSLKTIAFLVLVQVDNGNGLRRSYIVGFICELRRRHDVKFVFEVFSFKDNGKPPAHDTSFQLSPLYKKYTSHAK
jgi:GTPase